MSESNKAVFLSFASQDAEAARRICEALRAVGVADIQPGVPHGEITKVPPEAVNLETGITNISAVRLTDTGLRRTTGTVSKTVSKSRAGVRGNSIGVKSDSIWIQSERAHIPKDRGSFERSIPTRASKSN